MWDNNSYKMYPNVIIAFKDGKYKEIRFDKFGFILNDYNLSIYIKSQLLSHLPYNDRKMREVYE